MYYYTLLRFNISNQKHIRNRKNLEKSWKNVEKYKIDLKKLAHRKKYINEIIKYQINNLS